MVDKKTFLHYLSVNLASIAYDQVRLGNMLLSEEEITHLSQAFADVLKHMMEWHKKE